MKLYWVTTADHDEDWFMFAETEIGAAELHEDHEGYDTGDAMAEWVCDVPPKMKLREGWPQGDNLINLGAVFLRTETPRKVEINGGVYTEGGLDALIEMSLDVKH